MTRLLHTADVHLATDRPERQAALTELLELAETAAVDLVTVGGDLFESDVDSEALRPELRRLFADRPYDVLAIPGNHDAAAFRSDLHFGACFDAAVGEPFTHVQFGELRVTCVPYTATDVRDVLLALGERDGHDGPQAVLLHCSLETPFQDAGTGDESGRRYFPVTEGALADLGFDYYLAGHYHSAHRVELPDGGTVVYPGTPASITAAETGRRSVALVDTDDDTVEFRHLAAFHYDELEASIRPGEADAVLAEVVDWVAERRDRNVAATIRVTGHTRMAEADFAAALADAAGPFEVDNRVTGVEQVLSHPLYQAFEAKLAAESFDDEALEDAVRERAIRIFSELSAGGRLA